MTSRAFLLQGVAAAVLFAAASPAFAAPEPTPQASGGQAATNGVNSATATETPVLGEVVVTAQRKSENLQKAAIPVDVVSPEALRREGISSPEMLTQLVPSLTIANTGGAGMSLFLRGVGNFTLSPTFDSAVAFNYDNVYIGRPAGTTGFFYDLERIEVLKGPQGTLYGRNATGGAINVIPTKPALGQFGGFLNAGYGNYNAGTLEGAVNLPIGEQFALRVSGNLVKHDGYLSDGTSDADTKALRVQMLGEVTPNLTVRIGADYTALRGRGPGGSYLEGYAFNGAGYTQIASPNDLSVGLYDPRAQAFRRSFFVAPAGRFLNDLATHSYIDNDYYGVNGEIKLKTTAGDLTVIPSWRQSTTNGITATFPFLTLVNTKGDQYSLEARFAGHRIGIFDYTLGSLYFHEKQGNLLYPNQVTINTYQNINIDTESLAAFGRVTANLSDRLRLVGGARFTQDKTSSNSNSENVTVICATLPTPCFSAPLLPVSTNPSDLGFSNLPARGLGGVVPYLDARGVPVPGVLLSRSPLVQINQSLTASRFTWHTGVEFDVGARSLLYATVETGFRAGGLQPVNGYQIYKPEDITAYTIGSKNRFLDNRLQLNLEGFLWKYNNQQIAALGIDKLGVPGFFVQNVGASTISGAEAEAQFALTHLTRLSADIQYLHTSYDSFSYAVPRSPPAAPFVGCPSTPSVDPSSGQPTYLINCSGKPAFNSPTWTINLGVAQIIPLGAHQLIASVDTQFRGSRWIGYEYIPAMLQGATWQSNTQLRYEPVDGKWFLAAYVRNIENDRYSVNAVNYSFGSLVSVTTSPPRTYGMQVGVKF